MFRFTHAKDSNFTSSMSTRNSRPMGETPKDVGKTILIGGSVVAAGLLGFYYSMLTHKKREQAAGRNPYHEQVVAGLSRKTQPLEHQDSSYLNPLHSSNHDFSSTPPTFPGSDHHSGHQTIPNFYKEHGRGAPGTKSISGAQFEAQGRQNLSNADNYTLGNENVALDRAAGDEPVGTAAAQPLTSKSGETANLQSNADKRGINALRNMVPPPQRGRNDGSGKAYTKSPDFVKNYHKTSAGRDRVISGLGQSATMEQDAKRAGSLEGVSVSSGVSVPLSPKMV